MYYNELTTVEDVRSEYQKIISNSDDPLILEIIRSVCEDIERIGQRSYVPRIETIYRDAVADVLDDGILLLEDDLLEVTTLTNGDGTVIASDDYYFEPRHKTPYWGIGLLGSSGLTWQYQEDSEDAISIVGVWGYHKRYTDAWRQVDTLGAAVSSTTATTITLTTGATVKAGQLLKLDTEFVYASNEAGKAVTVVRAVNGSTAATHLINTPVYAWTPSAALVQLAKEASAARYRLRENPIAETLVIDGQSFATPKDVDKHLMSRMSQLGLIKTGI